MTARGCLISLKSSHQLLVERHESDREREREGISSNRTDVIVSDRTEWKAKHIPRTTNRLCDISSACILTFHSIFSHYSAIMLACFSFASSYVNRANVLRTLSTWILRRYLLACLACIRFGTDLVLEQSESLTMSIKMYSTVTTFHFSSTSWVTSWCRSIRVRQRTR